MIRWAGPTWVSAAGGGGRVRASDADRDRVVERLDVAYGEGGLSRDEHDGRLQSAFAARTYADLDQLVIDLPDTRAAVVIPGGRARAASRYKLACGFAQFISGRRWPSRRSCWAM